MLEYGAIQGVIYHYRGDTSEILPFQICNRSELKIYIFKFQIHNLQIKTFVQRCYVQYIHVYICPTLNMSFIHLFHKNDRFDLLILSNNHYR